MVLRRSDDRATTNRPEPADQMIRKLATIPLDLRYGRFNGPVPVKWPEEANNAALIDKARICARRQPQAQFQESADLGAYGSRDFSAEGWCTTKRLARC